MKKIVLSAGQIISAGSLASMLKKIIANPGKSIDPPQEHVINENDPLRAVKMDMKRRGLLTAYYESINSPQKEFANCM